MHFQQIEVTEEDNEELTDEAVDEYMKHLPILKKNVKNKNDRVLMLLSLVYDLNFNYSTDRIKNEKYVEKLYSHIKNKKLFKPYFDEVIKYLKGVKHEQ